MWTPKRILLMITGLLLCLTSYGVYLYFLGDLDALPPLPQDYWPNDGTIVLDPGGPPPELRWFQAFGSECEEVNRRIKLELQSKGWGMAADHFDIESDGRVKLTPFSAYLLPKSRGNPKFPEINTVRCDEAYLTMDRPVTHAGDLHNRRIVGVELRSKQGILIINNRSTAEKNDDLELRITNGSLFFDDNRSLVWTNGWVQLLDQQTQPEPTKVTAKGMDLYLTRDTTKQRDGKETKGEGFSGVERLVLRGNVDMHIFLDAQSGFLAGTQPPRPDAAAKADDKQEKSHVVIKTNGPFTFDVEKDTARFECPKPHDSDPLAEEHVLVQRQHPTEPEKTPLHDNLYCNTLVLEFRKRDEPQPRGNPNERSMNKEIGKAHATAYRGREVTLVMETENLEAYGHEMIYHKDSDTSGPQTIVKGKPMRAVKQGHVIYALELHLVGADKDGKGQRALAQGPGKIELFDKTKNASPMQAHWKDSMTVEKDYEKGPDGERALDLLTFTEEAVFEDKEQGKTLRAWRIQVWLESAQRPVSGAEQPKLHATATAPRQRPYRVDALKNVTVHSPELIVPHAKRFVVRFSDDLSTDDKLPELASSGNPNNPSAPAGDESLTLPPAGDDSAASPSGLLGVGPTDDNNDRKPIILEAREIAAYVARRGDKNELKELVTEGDVHVHQDGKTADDKGIDIVGEMLNLFRDPKGDLLYVYGDGRKAAQLQLGELVLVGPKVTINQQKNVAHVEGVGAMTLPSNTTLDGGKPSKSGTRVTIHWNKNMLFDGQYADFYGGIVAYQENAQLKCQNLQVALDKSVSLKTGQKAGDNATVDKILCDRNVYVLDEKKGDQGELLQYNRLEATQLVVDNQQGPTTASGPGMVYLIAKGAADLTGPPGSKNDAKEMKLTRIAYAEYMVSNKKPDMRMATFYGNVEVFHVPADKPDVKLNPDKLPKGGFFLRCGLLTVHTKNLEDNKTNQVMQAEDKVDFRAEKVFGRCVKLKYDDSSEIVIFDGAEGNPVRLYQDVGGPTPREIRGMKVLYNRRTGEFQIDGGKSIITP